MLNSVILISNSPLTKEIADKLEINYLFYEQREFSDTEVCPRILFSESISSLVNKDVVLFPHLRGTQNKNSYLVETYFLLQTIRAEKPHSIHLIYPYFSYMRQDKIFRRGEPLSAKYVAEIFEHAHLDSFSTVTTHFSRDKELRTFFPHTSVVNEIDGIALISKEVKRFVTAEKMDLNDVIIVSPDFGAIPLAKHAADILGEHVRITYLEKYRDRDTGEIQQRFADHSLRLEGKTLVIIDDIVASGSTISNAAVMMKEQGAEHIIFAYVHPVHSSIHAVDNLLKAEPRLVVFTNTILWDIDRLKQTPFKDVSITDSLVGWIKELLSKSQL